MLKHMAFSIDSLPAQNGRVAIVTGANTGLGFHNAADLAALGATVVMACRSAERGEEARQRILADVPDGGVQVMTVDLSSLDSVREFTTAFRSEHDRLDVLINNAAICSSKPFAVWR